MALLASILAAFVLGAGTGTLIYEHFPRIAMFFPVAFLIRIVYQDLVLPIAEIEPFSMVGGSGFDLPEALGVFHLRGDHDRKGRIHRMPNLLKWAARLPRAIRVVVIDLGEATQLNANAMMELQTLLGHFREEGRHLIIAGVSRRFQELQTSGAIESLPLDNLCGDMELAIARGLNLLTELPQLDIEGHC